MFTCDEIHNWESDIRLNSGDKNSVRLIREFNGDIFLNRIRNEGSQPAEISEIVLFSGIMPFKPETSIYGEGYNMLSQYGGTIQKPESIGSFDDISHYKMPSSVGMTTVYNLIMFSAENEKSVIMAFASCNRFRGEFRFNEERLEIVLATENLTLNIGEEWALEEFFIADNENIDELFNLALMHISRNHPSAAFDSIPRGWCTWYGYGPNITEKDIYENMQAIKRKDLKLKYIQIDDGYEAYIGDWLVPGSCFTTDIKRLCLEIKEEGFTPAIWVAPFIAEKNSDLLKEHPDWFVHNENGVPLESSEVTFGGWRNPPWYILDGSHPEAQNYLRTVFKIMHDEWKCEYFKLDANIWGALPFGKRYRKDATCIEAYREGMKAIIEGAGENSFILGCNAPMWPSLGLVHGMRVSNDISREWNQIKNVAKESLYRSWQHRRLWINDPDCVLLQNLELDIVGPDGKFGTISSNLAEEEFDFHLTSLNATGGMVFSGDRINELSDENIEKLKRILAFTNKPAQFSDFTFNTGKIMTDDGYIVYILNWDVSSRDIAIPVEGSYKVINLINDEYVGEFKDIIQLVTVSPKSGMILKLIGVH